MSNARNYFVDIPKTNNENLGKTTFSLNKISVFVYLRFVKNAWKLECCHYVYRVNHD